MTIYSTLQEQDEINGSNFLMGRTSKKWKDAQDEWIVMTFTKWKRSSQRWFTQALLAIWEVSWKQWQHRTQLFTMNNTLGSSVRLRNWINKSSCINHNIIRHHIYREIKNFWPLPSQVASVSYSDKTIMAIVCTKSTVTKDSCQGYTFLSRTPNLEQLVILQQSINSRTRSANT